MERSTNEFEPLPSEARDQPGVESDLEVARMNSSLAFAERGCATSSPRASQHQANARSPLTAHRCHLIPSALSRAARESARGSQVGKLERRLTVYPRCRWKEARMNSSLGVRPAWLRHALTSCLPTPGERPLTAYCSPLSVLTPPPTPPHQWGGGLIQPPSAAREKDRLRHGSLSPLTQFSLPYSP